MADKLFYVGTHATDDPTRNVDISDGPIFLSPDDLQTSVSLVRAAWTDH